MGNIFMKISCSIANEIMLANEPINEGTKIFVDINAINQAAVKLKIKIDDVLIKENIIVTGISVKYNQ